MEAPHLKWQNQPFYNTYTAIVSTKTPNNEYHISQSGCKCYPKYTLDQHWYMECIYKSEISQQTHINRFRMGDSQKKNIRFEVWN